MLLRIRLTLIRLFTINKIKVDRKTVEILSKEIFLRNNRKIEGKYYTMIDVFCRTKSRVEFEVLGDIMKKHLRVALDEHSEQISKLSELLKSNKNPSLEFKENLKTRLQDMEEGRKKYSL